MAFIYDNLVASLISTTAVLIFISIQAQATQINIAKNSRNASKNQAQKLATWLEEDLDDIGKNMTNDFAALEPPQDSTEWHTTKFTFKHYSQAMGDTVRIQYELKEKGTRTVGDTTVKLYQMERLRKVGNPSNPWKPEGRSTGNLGYFEVNMLGENGGQVTIPGDVESIRVRFSVIAPFQGENTFPRRVYRSTTVPFRLSRK
ncbi:Conserved hypothetical protein, secreted [Salinibacter ruber M8]|uniref:Uncharacterized protein n=1 Tax=Salinibacter ruber (strain M8) TaxID=761659 RepID=D5H8N1_SALRM|nr:hypothetical protein [Salinibacter ruber]CBH24386.1 Conserved hypothetical protein, secreted [Salinibacter ruber M8]